MQRRLKPNVFITRRIPDESIEMLSKHFNISIWDKKNQPVPRRILKEKMKNIDGLLCLLTDNIDKSLIDKTSNLKVISNMAVGFDNIDIESATNRKIMVTNTPEILTETTADLTFALLMSTARRLSESENYLRNGKWKTWSPMLLAGQDIHGANLGIIGLGRIGEALSKRAKGFNMNIYYYSRTRKKEKEKELGINYLDLNSVLK